MRIAAKNARPSGELYLQRDDKFDESDCDRAQRGF